MNQNNSNTDKLPRGARILLQVAELARQSALWYDRTLSEPEVKRMIALIHKKLADLKTMQAGLADKMKD